MRMMRMMMRIRQEHNRPDHCGTRDAPARPHTRHLTRPALSPAHPSFSHPRALSPSNSTLSSSAQLPVPGGVVQHLERPRTTLPAIHYPAKMRNEAKLLDTPNPPPEIDANPFPTWGFGTRGIGADSRSASHSAAATTLPTTGNVIALPTIRSIARLGAREAAEKCPAHVSG